MGTTSFAHFGRDTISLLKSELTGENSFGRWEWLDHATRGRIVYVVLKKTPAIADATSPYAADPDGSYRYILVVITERSGEAFSFKEIGETAGPVEKDCPERLLAAASPFKEGMGAFGPQWRADCRARRTLAREARAARPKPGDVFRTLKPVTFRDGSTHSEFTCVGITRRGRNATAYTVKGSGAFHRFKPAAYGFEIISTQTKTETAS